VVFHSILNSQKLKIYFVPTNVCQLSGFGSIDSVCFFYRICAAQAVLPIELVVVEGRPSTPPIVFIASRLRQRYSK